MTQVSGTDSIVHTVKNNGMKTPLDGIIQTLAIRFGGNKSVEVERFIKFAVVGLIGAIVDFGTLNVLQSTVLPPESTLNVAVAATIAFIAAVMSNFFWNRFWTYPDSRSRSVRRQLAQFGLVSLVGWMARTIWISAAYVWVGALAVSVVNFFNPGFEPTVILTNRIGANVAQLIAIFVVMIWNFVINRLWTYNDVDKSRIE